jgi:hypothetical protein
MTPGTRKSEVEPSKKYHDLEFEKRLALAMKEASSIRRVVKIWGILTTIGSLSSILLLILHLFKKI